MVSKVLLSISLFLSITLSGPLLVSLAAEESRPEKAAPLYLEVELQSLRDAFFNLAIGEDPNTLLEKERLLYRQGAYEKAVSAFRHLGLDQPSKAFPQKQLDEARYLAAGSYLRMGEYSKAESLYRRIPSGSEHYPYAQYGLAQSAIYRYDGAQAIRFLNDVADSAPSGPDRDLAWRARLTLAFFSLEQGHLPEAVLEFSKIPPGNPFYPQALFGSGWAFARQGEWTRALVFWQDLATRYPRNPYTHEILLAIGQSYSRLSAYVKAAEAYGEALRTLGDIQTEVTSWNKKFQTLAGLPGAEQLTLMEPLANLIGADFADRFKQYQGILNMESYISGILASQDVRSKTREHQESLESRIFRERLEEFLKLSQDIRRDLWNALFQDGVRGLTQRRESLLENSAIATVEIARNLRLANSRRGTGQSP